MMTTPFNETEKCPLSYCRDLSREGYLPSVLVNGSAMGGVDAVAVPVDSLDQPVVAGPSDGVQP